MTHSLTHYGKLLCGLLAVLLVSGCLVTADNPILPAGATGIDRALYGTWYGRLHPDDDPFYLHFLPYSPDKETPQSPETQSPAAATKPMTLLLVFYEPGKPGAADGEAKPTDETVDGAERNDDDSGWGLAKAYAATINGNHYLSVRFSYLTDSDAEEMDGYHLYLYQIDESGQLVMNRFSDDVLADLIEHGTLAGEVTGDSWSKDGRITASSAELVNFLKTVDPKTLVVSEQGVFRRVAP